MTTSNNSQPSASGETAHTPNNGPEYRTKDGLAAWWPKDGAWHVALPCPPIVDGLKTGGYQWTDRIFHTREGAIACIQCGGKAVAEVSRVWDNPRDMWKAEVKFEPFGVICVCESTSSRAAALDKAALVVESLNGHLCNSRAADQRKIEALVEAGERLLQWVEGYQRLANEKGGRYAVAISSSRSDAELFRAASRSYQNENLFQVP